MATYFETTLISFFTGLGVSAGNEAFKKLKKYLKMHYNRLSKWKKKS